MFGRIKSMTGCNNVSVNGVQISVPSGSNISIINGKVLVNGKPYTGDELDGCRAVNIVINGDVGNINCGNVKGDIDAGGSVRMSGR